MRTDQDLASLLANTFSMQDFSSAVNLCHLLMLCHDVPGDVVEMGCWKGDTAKLMRVVTHKTLWVYDRFTGLPEPTKADEGHREDFVKGHMAIDWTELRRNFEKDNIWLPVMVMGPFNLISRFQTPSRIAFAHIDADLFESTMDALMVVYPLLSQGAICVIHDYGWHGLPGVKKAVDEFLFNKPEKAVPLPAIAGVQSKQACFTKL